MREEKVEEPLTSRRILSFLNEEQEVLLLSTKGCSEVEISVRTGKFFCLDKEEGILLLSEEPDHGLGDYRDFKTLEHLSELLG